MPDTRQRIRRLVEIHRDVSQAGGISEARFESYRPELTGLKKDILGDLVWSPGLLVHIEDPVELEEARAAVDQLWDRVTPDDVLDEMMSGGYGGVLSDITGGYAERVVVSRPTFVSIAPSTPGFGSYLTEAFRCWLHGLNAAAVIVCHSLLDTALYEALGHDGSVTSMAREAASEDLITGDDREFVRTVNDHRNRIVHTLDSAPDSKTTNVIVVWTKDIVERLMMSRL